MNRKEFEDDVHVRLAIIEKELIGLRLVATILAAHVDEQSLRSSLRAAGLYAEVMDGKAAALPIREIIRELQAWATTEAGPAALLALLALQHLDAGQERQSALSDWYAQATDAELTQDVAQLLRKYGLHPAADDDAETSG